MNWSSNKFYEGKLIADKSVKNHLLKDLKNISKKENDDENLSECSLFLIDTNGYDMKEIYFDDENSRGNEGEVELINIHINELIENYSVSIDQIGKVGFLSDSRRINVAIRRARRHLCIFSNAQTVTHDPFIKRLIDYMIQHGQKIIFFKDQLYQKKSTKSFKSKQIKQKSKKVKEQKTECSQATNTLENVLTNILYQHIESFFNNQDLQELQFEDDLSPFYRRYVHQFAEKHNLQHINEDLGHQRHIIIRKNIPIEMKMITNEEEEEEENINEKFHSIVTDNNEEKIELSPIVDKTNLCRYCHKDIPSENLQLYELYCQRVNPLSSLSISTNQTSEKNSPKLNIASKYPKTVKKKANKSSSMDSNAPIDDLLEADHQQDNICNAQKCKIKIILLG
ncbi:unnamed protein product [Rotaria sordida]|uniref:R3H domain-containing protein n=1 Tax=Rotaria sordida TaxID=392033 RepID=A0A814QNB3_9BILA|nr:unnamed protein product [Rotaria sordida]CAF1282969.1 unnamed protein product [Rotaria sordida]